MAFDHDSGGAGGGTGTFDLFALMSVDTSRFGMLGFHDADPFASNAADLFDDVERVVTDGVAWTGEGQPQASVVMRSNAAALETARMQMRAGIATMDALATAVSKAQQEVNAILSTQTGLDVDLATASLGAGSSVVFYTEIGHVEVSADNLVTRARNDGDEPTPIPETGWKLDSVMTYVRSADLAAKQLLTRIDAARPVFSATATGKTLAYNRTLLSVAATTVVLSELAKRVWDEVGPLDWDPPPDTDTWSWTGGILAALGLDSWKSFISGQITDGFFDSLKKDFPRLKKFIPIVGTALTTYDFLEGSRRDPDEYEPLGVRTPFGTPHAQDHALQVLLQGYYSGDPGANLTLAQAARLQQLGLLEPDGHDYVEEARSLDEDVDAWRDGSLDITAIGPVEDGDQSAVDRLAGAVLDQAQAAEMDRSLDQAIPDRHEVRPPLLPVD